MCGILFPTFEISQILTSSLISFLLLLLEHSWFTVLCRFSAVQPSDPVLLMCVLLFSCHLPPGSLPRDWCISLCCTAGLSALIFNLLPFIQGLYFAWLKSFFLRLLLWSRIFLVLINISCPLAKHVGGSAVFGSRLEGSWGWRRYLQHMLLCWLNTGHLSVLYLSCQYVWYSPHSDLK